MYQQSAAREQLVQRQHVGGEQRLVESQQQQQLEQQQQQQQGERDFSEGWRGRHQHLVGEPETMVCLDPKGISVSPNVRESLLPPQLAVQPTAGQGKQRSVCRVPSIIGGTILAAPGSSTEEEHGRRGGGGSGNEARQQQQEKQQQQQHPSLVLQVPGSRPRDGGSAPLQVSRGGGLCASMYECVYSRMCVRAKYLVAHLCKLAGLVVCMYVCVCFCIARVRVYMSVRICTVRARVYECLHVFV